MKTQVLRRTEAGGGGRRHDRSPNVFPKPLRLDIPTEWRTCPHPGSRFQQELPMNVTALKSMRAYWQPMLVALRRIREAYLRRVPQDRDGWTVGSLERLSSLILTVPAYVLMRSHPVVANGQLLRCFPRCIASQTGSG